MASTILDLESALVDGGIPATAAKILSNAIANAASGGVVYGRRTADATPIKKMRLIDGDTRKYLLGNLDYPSEEAFRKRLRNAGDQFHRHAVNHPYADSQPATANPTLTAGTVKAGKYLSTEAARTDDVAQSEVGLNINDKGGGHPRLNSSTGAVESVPISVEIEPKGLMTGTVVEEGGRTVVKLTIINPELKAFLQWKWARTTAITTQYGGSGTLYAEGVAIPSYGAMVLVPK